MDLFLHIGMANGWDHVTVEARAYKQGFSSSWWGPGAAKGYYMGADAKGQTVLDAPACPWGINVPTGLATDLDVAGVVDGANTRLGSDGAGAAGSANVVASFGVRPHHDAGDYCCGFLYYESLASRYVKGTRGRVVFCHIPGETDDESLQKARNSILAVIGTAVEKVLENRTTARVFAHE